ncbi:MAG: hypothetical protein H6707_21205 [Deltaproteobacteria bacterium]|nr:hypothetical protein [Deltaproteobacteria bacterium]
MTSASARQIVLLVVATLLLSACVRGGFGPNDSGPADSGTLDASRADTKPVDGTVSPQWDAAGDAARATDGQNFDLAGHDLGGCPLGSNPLINHSSSASCSAGSAAIGGGFACQGSTVQALIDTRAQSYQVDCASTLLQSSVRCLQSVSGAVTSVELASNNNAVIVPCPVGKMVVGGGCRCAQGGMLMASTFNNVASWRCSCSIPGIFGRAVCVPAACNSSLPLQLVAGAPATGSATVTCNGALLNAGCMTLVGGGGLLSSAPSGQRGWQCTTNTGAVMATALCLR